MKEYQFHKMVVAWLDVALPRGSIYHHSPNEGKRHVNYHVKMKAMGMKAGFPDLCIFVPQRFFWDGVPCSIFLELKRPGGRTTSQQKKIHDQLIEAGAAVAVIDNFPKMKLFLSNLIELKDNTQMQMIEKLAKEHGV